MNEQTKYYFTKVVQCLINKYDLDELKATRATMDSFLYSSLELHAEETMHDDIEVNADKIYNDYINNRLFVKP